MAGKASRGKLGKRGKKRNWVEGFSYRKREKRVTHPRRNYSVIVGSPLRYQKLENGHRVSEKKEKPTGKKRINVPSRYSGTRRGDKVEGQRSIAKPGTKKASPARGFPKQRHDHPKEIGGGRGRRKRDTMKQKGKGNARRRGAKFRCTREDGLPSETL